ncbi:MAG: hypothetical protein ABR928_14440 [Terracidiphilus sp.]
MTGNRSNRSRDAWIWVTVAAISLTSLARAQSGIENARGYANPFIAFFADAHLADSGASAAAHRSASSSRSGNSGTVLNLLPVYFVGLVSPLSLLFAGSVPCLKRALPAPALAGRFQRPPPFLLS